MGIENLVLKSKDSKFENRITTAKDEGDNVILDLSQETNTFPELSEERKKSKPSRFSSHFRNFCKDPMEKLMSYCYNRKNDNPV